MNNDPKPIDMPTFETAPLNNATRIRAALMRAGTALDALHREVAAVMGEHSDEARECSDLHGAAREHAAREAGHALKALGGL